MSKSKRLDGSKWNKVAIEPGQGCRSKRVPGVVRICGHDVQVEFCLKVKDWDNPERSINGAALPESNIILLSGEGSLGMPVSGSDQEETFLHEVIHHIDDKVGINLKEGQVILLANALYQFLRDNDVRFYDE